MRNKLVKLGVSALLFATLLLPNTIALATGEEEATWGTMTPMPTTRAYAQTEVIEGKIYVIGGCNSSGFLSATEVYDPSNDTFTTLPSMQTKRYDFQTKVIDDKIYVIGGMGKKGTASGSVSAVEVYDPSGNSWSTLTPMSTDRRSFQAEVIDGKIYVIGGIQGPADISSTEVYDPSTNTWTTLASMSTARSSFQTEVIDGKIYALGGSHVSKGLVEVYNPSNDTWETLPSMSTHRESFQTEVINGKIYAIGGVSGSALSSVEVYDPSANSWTTLASMSTAKHSFQTEGIDGKIYAIGGSNGSSSLSSVEVYTPSTNSWTTLASMSTPRACIATGVINGKIYVFGGTNVGFLSSVESYIVTTTNAPKLKVVLEINEHLQLSVDDNLTENTKFTWSSSNIAVASVNENGVVTALATGNATITVTDGGSYMESINILVVENADAYRLALDLQVGNTSHLTVDDYTNTATATWASSDPSIATITNAGRVTAASAGLTLITATDEADNQIGQAYVRVRA